MRKELVINDQVLIYTLKRFKRSKYIRITILPGGECRVSAPRFALMFQIENLLRSKAEWIFEKMAEMEKYDKDILSSSVQKGDLQKYKNQALLLVTERLNYFNQFYNFTYGTIKIRNQKTRWGSCSRRGTLSFNYKIALLSLELADYIIVHELCHIGQFNHSQDFWNLVGKTIPNHQKLRHKLKHHIH